ncbi:tRNA (uridine(34)/cytosine(34)/5-carboxymethylaminomethyluridine(34)-2'-O)-methyltransferase TrmL [Hydromonas duriensis]|uniref:tRNA (cytidine(34)-2'-O)-methyltransferase n=1 Tax=Hydromonas duriensis TaxID=1527608 RepID=A0A4R6YAH7_9BURK|nr:tRNA (uridine(34)/cytosine(34)/5-carboxymethylaminomethyluridine(34)-2'-O)-methyltransferase TrmL [Hydromonas duriensis]TDR32580.1 tRNA (cytidine/uridine-2'-O-)-methyltransferase [Hydromonas duriensis]
MFNLVLVQPEIPPNTGNIIRLCANTGAQLHLVKPLGFPLDDTRMRRAGLDYHEFANLKVYEDWGDFMDKAQPDVERMFALTTKGSHVLSSTRFQANDWFVLGSETRGLPDHVRDCFPTQQRIRLPMMPNNRSLNLSNTAAIIVYEAWRQCDFAGGQ